MMKTIENQRIKLLRLKVNSLTLQVTNARLVRKKRLNRGAANLATKLLVRLPKDPGQKLASDIDKQKAKK